jgi:uncharacterized protein involved in outer membrane biogenesis
MTAPETPQKASLRTTLTVALAGLGVVLFIAPVLFVQFVLTPEWIDENVVPKIEEAIGREIKFEEIRLGFRGLQLKNLQISEDPAFRRDDEPHFATLDNMVLAVEFLPLLHRQVVIREIVLGDPLIVVHRNAENVWNVSSLAHGSPADEPIESEASPSEEGAEEASSTESESGGLTFAAENVRLQNARVIFIDEARDGRSRIELRRVQFTSGGVSMDHPFDLDATFEVLPGDGQPITAAVSGTVSASPPSFDLKASTGPIDVDDVLAGLGRTDSSDSETQDPSSTEHEPLDPGINAALELNIARISVSGLTAEPIQLKADLQEGQLNVHELSLGIFEGSARGSATIDLTQKKPRYAVQLLLENLSLPLLLDTDATSRVLAKSGEFDGKLTAVGTGVPDGQAMARGELAPGQKFLIESVALTEGTIGYTPLGESSPTLALTDVELSVPALYLDKASTGRLAATVVTAGSASSQLQLDALINIAKGTSELTARIDSLDIDALQAALSSADSTAPPAVAPSPTDAAGPDSSENSKDVGASQLDRWKIEARTDIDKVRIASMDGSELHAAVRYEGGVVAIDALSLNLAEGRVESSGSASVGDLPSPFDFKVAVKQLSIAELLRPYDTAGWGDAEGIIGLKADLRGTRQNEGSLEESLNGAIQVDIPEGSFTGAPILKTLATFTGVPELAALQMKDSGGRFLVTNGRVETKRFLLGGDEHRIIILGEAGLDGSLDVEAKVGVSPTAENQPKLAGIDLGSDLLRASDGWAEIPVAVGGTLSSPVPSLPKRSLVEKAKELIPNLGQKVGGEVGELLRGLGGLFGSEDDSPQTPDP